MKVGNTLGKYYAECVAIKQTINYHFANIDQYVVWHLLNIDAFRIKVIVDFRIESVAF